MSTNDTPPTIEQVTEQDLQSFAQKLEAWGESLPNHERALLQILLTHADAGEVQGFGYNFAFASPTVLAQMTPLVFRGIGVSASDDTPWSNAHWMNGNFQGLSGMQQRT